MELVRRHDALLEQRNQLTGALAECEGAIATVRAELDGLLTGRDEHAATMPVVPVVGTLARKFIETLQANPEAGYAVLATALYGEDSPTIRNRVRAVAHDLITKGLLADAGRGRWALADVTTTSAAGEAPSDESNDVVTDDAEEEIHHAPHWKPDPADLRERVLAVLAKHDALTVHMVVSRIGFNAHAVPEDVKPVLETLCEEAVVERLSRGRYALRRPNPLSPDRSGSSS